MQKEEKCPYCDAAQNVVGKQVGMRANKKITIKEQPIYHVICLNCGTIIRSYVKEPKEIQSEN